MSPAFALQDFRVRRTFVARALPACRASSNDSFEDQHRLRFAQALAEATRRGARRVSLQADELP